MPTTTAVMRWLNEKPELVEQYTRARELQAETLFDELLDIADDASNDWMEINKDGDTRYELNGEHTQRTRIRIDVRKWKISKMLPKKYGDRVQNDHAGRIAIETTPDLSKLSDAELRLLAEIQSKSGTREA
jgi:hypothetical protein